MARRQVIVSLAAAVVLLNPTAAIAQPGPLVPDPAGLISFPAGYSYTNLITSCQTPATSTESGVTFPYPDDCEDGERALVLSAGGDEKYFCPIDLE